MLYSQFFIADTRYVISIDQITAIVPYVTLKVIPGLPDYAAGLLHYHGKSVPVIDLCQLFIGRPCGKKLSTRIILVTLLTQKDKRLTLGLLVERATETFSAEEGAFVDPGMHNPELPFIGPVTNDLTGIITMITPRNIFDKIDDALFTIETFTTEELPALDTEDGGTKTVDDDTPDTGNITVMDK
ncbi:MAG: chemotaxis protein CheW [Ectothiorhodospiraceae bacterium]|nr:chemotaxis protein CheW [Ectothiorhodospiraceae bacterium]